MNRGNSASFEATLRSGERTPQSEASEPDASFVIVNYNTCDDLRRCLQSIVREVRGVAYEIIVIDNGSIDDSVDMVRREFPEVNLVSDKRNMFVTAVWNKGIRLARGRFVLIANPDVTFLPGSFQRMYTYIQEHPDVAAVSPRLQNDDGSTEACFWRPRTFPLLLYTCTFLRYIFPRRAARLKAEQAMLHESRTLLREVEMFIDVCMLARTEALASIGWYDERFKLYFYDDDICLRLRRAGWRLVFLGDVVNHHARHQSVIKEPSSSIISIMREDAVKYCRKHFGISAAALLLPLIGTTALLRELRLRISGSAR